MKKDAYVNFLNDSQEGRLKLKSIDVLVYGWVRGNMHVHTRRGLVTRLEL